MEQNDVGTNQIESIISGARCCKQCEIAQPPEIGDGDMVWYDVIYNGKNEFIFIGKNLNNFENHISTHEVYTN